VLQEMNETGKVDPAYKKIRGADTKRAREDGPLDMAKDSYRALNRIDKRRFRSWLKTPDAKIDIV